MTNLRAIIAYIILRFALRKLLKQLLRPLEILGNKDFGMIIRAFGSLLTKSIHIVPAELPDDMFELTGLSMEAEPHIKVRTALIDVAIGAMLPFLTFLPHEVGADLKVMAEVAFISIPTRAHTLEFVAWFYLTLIVRMWAIVG